MESSYLFVVLFLLTRSFLARRLFNQIGQLIGSLISIQLRQQLVGKVHIRLAPPAPDEVVPNAPTFAGFSFRYESSFWFSHNLNRGLGVIRKEFMWTEPAALRDGAACLAAFSTFTNHIDNLRRASWIVCGQY